jgi:hypothetical protein
MPDAKPNCENLSDSNGLLRHRSDRPLAYWQLGRVYDSSQDKAKAKRGYEGHDEFFNSWKDADLDIPILKHASLENATLG